MTTESAETEQPIEVIGPISVVEDAPVGKEFTVSMPVPRSLRKRFGRKAIEKAACVHFFVFLAANADTRFGYEWDLVPDTLLTPTWIDDSAVRGPGAKMLRISGRLVQVPVGKARETGQPINDPENPHGGSPDQP